MKYVRICKYCDDYFQTDRKYSEVCDDCSMDNHERKVMKNLFNHQPIIPDCQ
jgi:hypothetical protein